MSGRQHRIQGTDNHIQVGFHGAGAGLHHQHIVETIHHQAGQAIGFAVDQAVAVIIKQLLAQGQRLLDALFEETARQFLFHITAVKAGRDQRMGAEQRTPQRLAAAVFHDTGTRRQILERSMTGINFVGVYPQMARLEAALFIFAQANNSRFGHGAYISWPEREG